MKFNNYLKAKIPFVAILGLFFGLVSCGSYQYVGVDNDGIYGEPNTQNTNQEAVVEINRNGNTNNGYYDNYFKNKAQEYEIATDNGAIFTDIDSYSSDENLAVNDTIYNDYQGHAGWGQTNDRVVINYIDNGWNNWGWDPWFNAGWGWGWNNWGWNRWNRWGWGGWNNWGWNAGFGWGWNNWGWGWNAWCPPGFYGNNFYAGVNNRFYNRGYAFNNSRRGSSIYGRSSNNSIRRSSSSVARRSSINSPSSRYSSTRRSSISSNNGRTSTTYRRSSSPATINRNSTVRRSSTRQPSYSTSRSSSSVTRSSTPIRRNSSSSTYSRNSSSSSNNSSYSRRSSSSNTRSYSRSSSGSSRSSSGSSRSSSGGRRR